MASVKHIVKQSVKQSNMGSDERQIKGRKIASKSGEPHRNRTCNLLIKSQLLCQLS